MKRLVLLTALALVLAGTTGCRCFDWLRCGAPAQTMIGPPCEAPCGTTCGTCPTSATVGACDQVLPGPCGYSQPQQ